MGWRLDSGLISFLGALIRDCLPKNFSYYPHATGNQVRPDECFRLSWSNFGNFKPFNG